MGRTDLSVEAIARADLSTNYFCVNLRDPTTLRLRRTGLREIKSALRKISGICIYVALFLL